MGTNYYIDIPRKRRLAKKNLKSLIDEDKFDELRDEVNKVLTESYIHLGKKSYGWKFLFDANDCKYYDLTKKGINKFIRENKAIIKNEYGEVIPFDEFWNEIVKVDGWDAEKYHDDTGEPSSYICSMFDPIFEKYKPNMYGEFYSDGFRFTVHTDFS